MRWLHIFESYAFNTNNFSQRIKLKLLNNFPGHTKYLKVLLRYNYFILITADGEGLGKPDSANGLGPVQLSKQLEQMRPFNFLPSSFNFLLSFVQDSFKNRNFDAMNNQDYRNQMKKILKQSLQYYLQAKNPSQDQISLYYKMAIILDKMKEPNAKEYVDRIEELEPQATQKQVAADRQHYYKKTVDMKTQRVPHIEDPERVGRRPGRLQFQKQKHSNQTASFKGSSIDYYYMSQSSQQLRFKQTQFKHSKSLRKISAKDIEQLKSHPPKIVQNPLKQKYPYSAVGKIHSEITKGNQKFIISGTACLIGPNIILTAAHNIYYRIQNKDCTNIRYIPAPEYEKGTMYTARKCFVPIQYKQEYQYQYGSSQSENQRYDYALIQLDTEQDLQAKYGSLSYDFNWQQSQGYQAMLQEANILEDIKVFGFPKKETKQQEFFQFQGDAFVDSNYLIHGLPTSQGVSGAPNIELVEQQYFVRAIHVKKIGRKIPNAKAGLQLRGEMFDTAKSNFTYPVNSYSYESFSYGQKDKQKQQRQMKELIQQINKKQKDTAGQEKNKIQLHLSYKKIGDEGCRLLTQAQWHNLRTLNLSNNNIGDKGCRHLAQAQWHNLQTLQLSNNNIADKGCRHLASSKWQKLQTLSLSNNNIGDEGSRHLASSKWPNLQTLILYNTKIGDEGCRYLASAQWLYLQKFSLTNNRIGEEGCKNLASSKWHNLQTLNLYSCEISDEGCKHLALAQWPNLQMLSLYSNQIGDEGCRHLASSKWQKLQTLSLSNNKIGDEGCKQLAQAHQAQWHNLQTLNLWVNAISKQCKGLFKNPKLKVQL